MWVNKKTWLNELWCGDNYDVLKNIPSESVDLIYIDPPFFSNRNYEIIWGNGAEKRSFEDRWAGRKDHYIKWMVNRIKELHRILKPTGSIFLHLDWHAVHHIKVEMDKIFDADNFRNDIIWCYTGPGHVTKHFKRKHDNILFYSKSKKSPFYKDEVKVPYSESYKQRRQYSEGEEEGIFSGKEGVTKESIKGGKILEDWWIDIPAGGQISKSERLGYPTQKPEALLERIIKAASKEGDIVLDAFCGCGTTIAVAERLNRKWIGIDVSPIAVKVMTERLQELERKMGKDLEDFITYGLPEKTISHLSRMDHKDFEDWVIQQIDGKPHKKSKVNDFGIDGFTKEGEPIQIKRWKNKVGRPSVFNFEAAIQKEGSKSGTIYGFHFSKDAKQEVARANREHDLDIKLVTIDELIEKYGDHTHRK